jgi:hypothetical protein
MDEREGEGIGVGHGSWVTPKGGPSELNGQKFNKIWIGKHF